MGRLQAAGHAVTVAGADQRQKAQFLSISHNKITMQKSDRLIGVSMPEPGVSKIVAVDLEKIPE